MLLTYFHQHLIRLDHVNFFNRRIPCELLRHAAVTTTDDQDMPDIRVHCHRDMCHHLVIDKLIFF